MWKYTKRISITFVLVAGVLAGCGADETIQEEVVNTIPTEVKLEQSEQVNTVNEQSKFLFPLTGLSADTNPTNRVVGVMINNHPKARPQSGLYKADVVYEVLAEGFVTRFLALYHSEAPKVIGPVRSARDYYIDLNNGFNAIYVCHGFSPEAQVMLNNQNVADDLNGLYYDGTLFQRADFRSAPHNSYITYENILKGAEENDYKLTQHVESLPFLTNSEINNISGQNVLDFMITYSDYNTVSYTYSEADEKYYRYSNGEKTADRETDIPVQVDNVFIVEAPHTIIDNVGRREVDLEAGGQAYLFQKGTINEVTWKNVDGRILPYKDNKLFGFVPGKTWINVIPQSPGLSAAVSIQSE
ncbi:DUF3048 domain-containing protein [Bacillus solimangrovi]|uniref:Lipoprotein YerB n=1 Tax=Bacillus solimangrovi TaxID=1305675 RepID=A0A1E5LH38_9BACI|nr:hypothetical protein BFG57_12135 [Bacillus solimangrovi]